jgi:hypothetical protein
MGAWMGVYLPWNYMAEYYMLPFTMGLAVFASALIVEIIPGLHEPGWKKWFSIATLAISCILFVGSLFNTLTNARVQLAMDDANSHMMEYVSRSSVSHSVILVNFQDFTEYLPEMQTQFESLYGRPDLQVEMFIPGMPFPESEGETYLVTAVVQNQPLLTVRMGVEEESQKIWNESLKKFIQSNPKRYLMNAVMRTIRLSDVNYPRLFCPLINTRSFCAIPAPLVDTRPFTYGWRIYKLENP